MPAAIPAAVSALVVGGGAYAAGQTIATAAIIAGITFAGNLALGYISEQLAPEIEDYSNDKGGKQLTITSTVEPRRLIYGETLVSGVVVYRNTAGKHNGRLFTLIALAGHEIEDITDIWLDDAEIPAADINWGTDGSVDDGFYGGDPWADPAVYFQKGLGTSTQAASSFLTSHFSDWTSSHQGKEVAWLCARFDYIKDQQEVWERGAPNNIKALVKGKKVYDPRLDSTQPGGSGTHRVADESTWEWSDNPALCTADYIMHALGMDEDSDRIDWDLIQDAADRCDGTVSIPPSGTQTRFTCNGVLDAGDTHKTNLTALLSSMNGSAIFSNGKWRIRAWQYETPTISLTDEDLRETLKMSPNKSMRERYNTVRATYIDPDRQYQPSAMIEVTSSTFQTRDGEKLARDIKLPMTNNELMAQRLALGLLEQSDHQKIAYFPGKMTCYQVNIGEAVQLTYERFGWTNKVFRCVGWKLTDKGVDLVLREDDSNIYTDPATGDYATRTAAGTVTFPTMEAPIVDNFLAEATSRGAQLTWDSPAARLYDVVEIWRSVSSSDKWGSATKIAEVRGEYYLDEIEPGVYWYFARTRNYEQEVSTRQPLDGYEVATIPDDFLIVDPGFEMTRLQDGTHRRHWLNISTVTNGTHGKATMLVESGDGGHGGGHKLGVQLYVNSEQSQLFSFSNAKTPPLNRGLTLNMWMRYRVPTYLNVKSAFIDFNVFGRRNARSPSSLVIGSTRVTFTNSTDWDVASWQQAVSALTNVESYSLMRAQLEFNCIADTSTADLKIEIDEVFLNYTG